jgi:hypothetical protein
MKNESVYHPEPKVKDIKKILPLVHPETNERITTNEVIIRHRIIIHDLQMEHLLSKISNSENGMMDILNYNTTTECL